MPICTCHFASPVKRFSCDCITHENPQWMTSIWTKKSLFINSHIHFNTSYIRTYKWLQWIRAVIQYSTHHIIILLMPLKSLCIMMSSNGNISALLALCIGNQWVTSEFPSQKPVMQSFDIYFLWYIFFLIFSLICARTNIWANNLDTRDLRCHCAHYDIRVWICIIIGFNNTCCNWAGHTT